MHQFKDIHYNLFYLETCWGKEFPLQYEIPQIVAMLWL